jgi:hypothetical protein
MKLYPPPTTPPQYSLNTPHCVAMQTSLVARPSRDRLLTGHLQGSLVYHDRRQGRGRGDAVAREFER